MSLDRIALSIMLSKAGEAAKQAALKRVAGFGEVMRGDRCPECGGTKCEDNGARGYDLTFLCVGCGHQWMPAEETQSVDRILSRDW